MIEAVSVSFVYAGPILRAKAKQLHEKLCEAKGKSKKFVASSGWLAVEVLSSTWHTPTSDARRKALS